MRQKLSYFKNSLDFCAQLSSLVSSPWRCQCYFNEIKSLFYMVHVAFKHARRSANAFANAFTKKGVDRSSHLVGLSL